MDNQSVFPGTEGPRPVVIRDLVARTLRTYRRHLLLLWAVTATVEVPYAFLYYAPSPRSLLYPAYVPAFVADLPTVVIDLVTSSVQFAAVICVVADASAGRRPTFRDVYRRVLRALPAVAGLSALYGLALLALLATVVCIPFAIYLAVAWTVAEPALLIERLSVREAFSRSRSLVRGRWGDVLGVDLLALIVPGLAILPALALREDAALRAIPLAASPAAVLLRILIAAAVGALISPLSYCPLALLYFDLRASSEAEEQPPPRSLGSGRDLVL